MSQLTVTQRSLDEELIETVRRQLLADDPYLGLTDDHISLVRTNHKPATFVVESDSCVVGYAVINTVLKPKPATLDIVVVEFDGEMQATLALCKAALDSTSSPLIWWSHGPRTQFVQAISEALGGATDRIVVHMQRSLDGSLQERITTHPFTLGDIDEVVRINNEAFASHPDRSNFSAALVKHDLEVQGNHFDYLRLTDGAFCWLKIRSETETECFVMAIDNVHQGKGLGAQLLESALFFAHSKGATKTFLYVEHDNLRAIALYERLGFERTNHGLHSVRFR